MINKKREDNKEVEELKEYKAIISELGIEKFKSFIETYEKTQISKYFRFDKIYYAYISEMEEENRKVSSSTFRRFLVKRNTEFVFGDYSWFKELSIKGGYLN